MVEKGLRVLQIALDTPQEKSAATWALWQSVIPALTARCDEGASTHIQQHCAEGLRLLAAHPRLCDAIGEALHCPIEFVEDKDSRWKQLAGRLNLISAVLAPAESGESPKLKIPSQLDQEKVISSSSSSSSHHHHY